MLLKNNAYIQVGIPEDACAKVCTVCLQTKQKSLFHLKGADKFGVARWQSSCKECANKKRVARYLNKKLTKKSIITKKDRFDIACCKVDIIYKNSKEIMTEIMADYVEASYAVSIKSTVIKAKD
jgi:hypothetical protein